MGHMANTIVKLETELSDDEHLLSFLYIIEKEQAEGGGGEGNTKR